MNYVTIRNDPATLTGIFDPSVKQQIQSACSVMMALNSALMIFTLMDFEFVFETDQFICTDHGF